MKRLLAAVGGLIALAGAASAQTPGYVTTNVNLRAGPDTSYPAVAVLGAGSPLDIFGCLDAYTWCDVDWQGYRGWVAAQYLQYDYRGRRVGLPDYAPMIGVPIIGFSVDNYWGRYYRDRPWYGDRYRWSQPPGYRPPPPGGYYGAPPPRGGWNNAPPPGNWNGGPPPGNWNGRPPQGNWNGAPPPGQGRPPGQPPQQGRPVAPPPQQQGRPPMAPPPNAGPPPQQQQRPMPPAQQQNRNPLGSGNCTPQAQQKGDC